MERSENRNSILANKIDSFSSHLTFLCQRYIDLAPDDDIRSQTGEENFNMFLNLYSFEDDAYMSFISDCGMFGASTPVESFQIFQKTLPKISLDSKTPPKSDESKKIVFTDGLKNIDWSSESKKAAIFYLIESLLADFLSEMLHRLTEISDSDQEYFYEQMVSFIKSPFNALNCNILKNIAERRMKTLYYLSLLNTEHFITYIKENFSTESFNSVQKIAYFKIFSSVVIKNGVELKNLISVLQQEYNECTNDLLDVLGDFLFNLCTQIFIENPDVISMHAFASLLYKIKESAHVTKIPSSIALFAATTKNSVEEYFKEEVENEAILTSQDAEKFCRGLVIKLFNGNYKPKVYLLESRCYLKWIPEIENKAEFYQKIAAWFLSIKEVLIDADEYASQLIEMLCYNDPELFLQYIFPELSDLNIFTNPLFPLIKGMYNVISNLSEEEEERFEELKSHLVKFVISCVIHLKLNVNNMTQKLTVNSFTAGLTASSNESSDQLKKMCKSIMKTSFPIYGQHDESTKSNAKIKGILDNLDYDPSTNYFTKDKEPEKVKQTDKQNAIIPLNCYLLMLSLYLNPEAELINILCLMLFDESMFTDALAVRTFQAMIHRNNKFAELIVCQLCKLFIEQNVTFIAIINIINALMHVLEATNIENVELSQNTMNSINYVFIIGLCIPLPSLRNNIFEMCYTMKKTKNANFTFVKFLEQTHDLISKRAQNNAINLISILSSTDKKLMQYAKFTEVANSNYSSLYIFYIASLGYYLVRDAKNFSVDFQTSLLFIHKILIKLLLSTLDEKMTNKDDIMFQYNCATMLISISDINTELGEPLSYFNMKRIQHICRYIIDELIETNKTALLIGVFSSCGRSLFNYIIPLLSEPIISIQMSLVLIMRNAFLSKSVSILDEDGEISMPIYTALQSTLLTIVRNDMISPKFNLFNPKCKNTLPPFLITLELFAETLKMAFDEIYNSSFSSEKRNLFNNSMWFIFFNNILLFKSAHFVNTMAEAFASWIRIAKIPEQFFDQFTSHIIDFSHKSINIPVVVFQQNPKALIDIFIKGAKSNFSIFMGLALQIELPRNIIDYTEKILEDAKEGHKAKLDSLIIDLYYENIGNLIALCFVYLISQFTKEREAALNFVEKLVFIAMMKRNDLNNACIILKEITNVRPIMTTTFAVFIQNNVYQLMELIADHFGFCSEQFISQCFNIVVEKKKEVKVNKGRRASGYQNNHQRITQNRRKSTLKQRASIYGTNQDEVFKQLKSQNNQSSDCIEIDAEEIIMNLVPLWLKQFTFDFNKPGICPNCENHFVSYGIYQFIKELLNVCSLVGMIQAIAVILDKIIEKDLDYFIYCLISMQDRFEEQYRASAQTFLIYLYNKDPSMFIKYIGKYFDMPMWYFFNIQNQLEQDEIEREEPTDIENCLDLSYTSIMLFIVDLIIECFKENEEFLAPIRPYIIVFCDIMTSDTYSRDNEVTMIAEDLSDKIEELMALLINVNDKRKYKNKLPSIYKQCKVSYLIKWGFSCGWLPAAKKALTMLNRIGYVVNKEELNIVLRAMQCVVEVLNERTDPLKKSVFNKSWALNASMGKRNIDVFPAINYLSECLVCIKNYVIENKETECNNAELFNIALQYLSFSTVEQSHIFTNAASLVSFFIMNTTDIEKLTEVAKEGIFDYFVKCSELDADSLKELGIISLECATRKLFKLFSSEYYLLYVIIPFMLNQSNDEEFCRKVANSFSSNNDVIFETITDKSRKTKTLEEFNNCFIEKIKGEHINKILHIYAQIAKYGNQIQRESAFCMTGIIMNYIPNKKEQIDLATIAQIAIIHQDNHTNEAVINFINELIKINLTLENVKPFQHKLVPLFPLLHIYPTEKIVEWEPEVDDIFDELLHYPPMYVADGMFFGATFLDSELNAIKKVNIKYFTAINDKYKDSAIVKINKTEVEQKDEKFDLIMFLEKFNEVASLLNKEGKESTVE